MPRVTVVERDDEIVLEGELLGVKKGGLEIRVTADAVTRKGQSGHKEKEQKGDYSRCEIASGSYSRAVALPGSIDTAVVKASSDDGRLRLSMPRLSKATRRRIVLG